MQIFTQRRSASGFTLVELVMVITLLSVLSAVVTVNFIDMRKDAKNAALKGALGAYRSAIAIAKAAIALKSTVEEYTAKPYPAHWELARNRFESNHQALRLVSIMGPPGKPENPWSPNIDRASVSHPEYTNTWSKRTVHPCNVPKGTQPYGSIILGFCYNSSNGQIWAATANNGGTASTTENNF